MKVLTRIRSAISGRFVSKKAAAASPDTTVSEKVRWADMQLAKYRDSYARNLRKLASWHLKQASQATARDDAGYHFQAADQLNHIANILDPSAIA